MLLSLSPSSPSSPFLPRGHVFGLFEPAWIFILIKSVFFFLHCDDVLMWTCLWVMATLSVKWKATRVSRPWQTNRGAANTTRSWVGPTDFLLHLQKCRICCCSIVGRAACWAWCLNCFQTAIFLFHVRLCAAPTGTSQSRFSPVLVFRQPTYGGARRPRCLCCGRRLCFCSIIGWGGKWKALRSCSPLFLSSCVLTFSPYLSLSPSPCRTTHWVSTRSETEARQDLAAQPGPPTQSRRGTPISTSQPIKVSFATHM